MTHGKRKTVDLGRIALLLMVICLPFCAMGQEWGCGVKVKAADKATLKQGITQYENRHYSEAAKLLRRVAQKNPKAAEPQFWLGMCGVRDGFNATAIRKYFTRCIELCPNYPNGLAHFYMGMIYYTDERYEDAVASLENYFKLANNHNDDRSLSAVYEEASNYLYWSQFLAEAMLNMAPFDPYRVNGVSSKYPEALPYLSLDGKHFYYLRQVPVNHTRTFYARELEETTWKIFRSDLKDTAFSKGIEMPTPFNQGDAEGSVSITADGRELYFSRITNQGGYNNSDLYYTTLRDGKWQPARPLGNNINGATTWESQPSITPDGSVLYFASNRKGGQGGIDLWRCRRLKNGDWSRPENLGPTVNTPGNDKFPFIAADGHTLYFLSDGWQGFGGYDIYFSDMNDPYGNRPTNLGLPINTENDEVSFGVTPDGRKGYYTGRTEGSRSTDVLMFDLYPAAQPDPMQRVTFAVGIAPHTTPDSVTVCLHRHNASTVTYYSYNNDGDVAMMLPEKGESLVTITAGKHIEITYVDSKIDGSGYFISSSDTLLAELTFETGSRLTTRSERLLDAWAEYLVEHPRLHLVIECPKITDAKSVYDYFVKKKKLRAERFSHRGGTDVKEPRFVLQ